MTDSATAERDYLAELARRPAARSPSTLSEIWDSEWKRSGLDTLTGVGKPLTDAYDDLVKQTEAAAGKPIGDFVPGLADAASTDERAQLIGTAIATLPEDKRKALEPLTDVRRRAAEAAQKTEREASEVSAGSSGISGVATSWAAGIARQALDPVNLATLPLGGPLKGPLLRTIAREAGIGALTQAMQEPAIEAGRAELGLESGFGRGATNVAEAALGAGGLTALFRAGAWAARKALPTRDIRAADSGGAVFEGAPVSDSGGVPINAPAPSPASRLLVPEDFEALAARAERDQMVDAVAPVQTADGLAAHAAGVEGAAASIERGRDIEGAPLAAEPLRPEPPARLDDLPLPEELRAEAPVKPDVLANTDQLISDQQISKAAPLGDPVLAREFDRVMQEAGDFEVQVGDERVKASEGMRRAESEATAARELTDCIGAAA